MENLSQALANFALGLHCRTVAAAGDDRKSTGNLTLSPFAVVSAMSALYAGAECQTRDQLRAVVFNQVRHLDSDLHATLSTMRSAMIDEEIGRQCGLRLVTRLYANSNCLRQLRADYADLLERYYRSHVHALDCQTDDQVRRKVNNWVSQETDGRVTEFIDQQQLHFLQSTSLVSISAVAFAGRWLRRFDPKNNCKGNFYVAPDRTVQVEMMCRRATQFHYYDNSTFQLLGLPYLGERMIMYILLPHELDGLDRVENSLNGAQLLNTIESALLTELAEVQLPKFKLSVSTVLDEPLQRLGIKDLFEKDVANLSNINGCKNLFVSSVLHKVSFEINESGTDVPSTLSSKSLLDLSDIDVPISFIADHPFMFLVYDKDTENILITGRYCGQQNDTIPVI